MTKGDRRLISVFGCLVIVLCFVAGMSAKDRDPSLGYDDEGKSHKKLAREGTSFVNQLGEFHSSGDSIRFKYIANGVKRDLSALENLALERVANELLNVSQADHPTWSVSGTLTEFRGTNYVLIRRSVMKVKKQQ